MHGLVIISGGQTGADRAALDWAIRHQIPHAGWCPKGRLAEDGPLPARYQLRETVTSDYAERTEKNVLDSDGTVIFTLLPQLTGGCWLTAEFAQRHRKPWLHLHPRLPNGQEWFQAFLQRHALQRLNVAGSRASKEPGVGDFVDTMLSSVLAAGSP